MLSAFDLNEIPPAHSPLDLTWPLISMSVIFERHRYLLIHLFIIDSSAFGTLITAPSLLIPSVPYHVFHPQSGTQSQNIPKQSFMFSPLRYGFHPTLTAGSLLSPQILTCVFLPEAFPFSPIEV